MFVYEYLVEGIRRDVFDKIVFALVGTLVGSLGAHQVFHTLVFPALVVRADSNMFDRFGGLIGKEMVDTTLCAVVLSIALAVLNNQGVLLGIAQVFRITYKTSAADVWQDVFYRFRGYWVRVSFADGRD